MAMTDNIPRKTYFFTQVDDLVFDAILLMIVLGLHDNAFESDAASFEDIFKVKVKRPRRSLDFTWKKSMLKVPIFRHTETINGEVRTSPTKALRYQTYLYYLQRLGIQAGFMQLLTAYCIRRGVGESVESKPVW